MTIEAARAAVGDDLPQALSAAIDLASNDLRPVPRDRSLRADWADAMDERLRRLAAKIAPGMSIEQGQPWREAMVEALSDLPAMVSLTAAKRAMHRPMQFLNQVETVVRELAAEVLIERNAVLKRLQSMQAEIERAARAQPAIAARPDADKCTPEEIRSMTPAMRRMGLSLGSLTQAEIDDALAQGSDRVAPPRAAPTGATPTLADYVALGMSSDDAATALADHQRMMRRGARPVAAAAATAVDAAVSGVREAA